MVKDNLFLFSDFLNSRLLPACRIKNVFIPFHSDGQDSPIQFEWHHQCRLAAEKMIKRLEPTKYITRSHSTQCAGKRIYENHRSSF